MSTLNKVQIIGRLGADFDLNETKNGLAVANISLATDNYVADGENTTEWHRVVLWDKNAINTKEYVNKGDLLYVEGKVQTRSYEKEGQTVYTTEIVANKFGGIIFLGKGGSGKGLGALGVGQDLSTDQNFGADAPF